LDRLGVADKTEGFDCRFSKDAQLIEPGFAVAIL
jgi:hypothetical protein